MLEQLEAEQILLIVRIMMMIAIGIMLVAIIAQRLIERDTKKIECLLLTGMTIVLLGISSLIFFYRALLAPIYISVIGIPAALVAIAMIITIMIRNKQTS